MAGTGGSLARFGAMGQPIVVTEKPSATNRGVVRFETNRLLTGMDHERYREGEEIFGHRPPDELARRLLAEPSVSGVSVHGNMVTVDLHRGYPSDGLRKIIEDLYIFYPVDEQTESEVAEDPGADGSASEAVVDSDEAAGEIGSDEAAAAGSEPTA